GDSGADGRGRRFRGCSHRPCLGFRQKVHGTVDSIAGPSVRRKLRTWSPDDRDGVGHVPGCPVVVHGNVFYGCGRGPGTWPPAWWPRQFRIFVRRDDVLVREFLLGDIESVPSTGLHAARRAGRHADVGTGNSWLE